FCRKWPELAALTMMPYMVVTAVMGIGVMGWGDPVEWIWGALESHPWGIWLRINYLYLVALGVLKCMHATRAEVSNIRAMMMAFWAWYAVTLWTIRTATGNLVDLESGDSEIFLLATCLWGILHLVWMVEFTAHPGELRGYERSLLARRPWSQSWFW